MKAVAVKANREIEIKEIDIPQIENTDDVLVKVKFSGVCGSDIPRIFHNGAHFYPIILGHEFSGIVVKTGKNVEELKIGDKVVCAPLLPCFQCEECQKGFYSLCKNYTFIGSRKNGANAEYICINKHNLVKIDINSNLLQSSFIEPITVGLHAINLANGCKNKNVIIIGAGTIGLLVAQAAKALGAKTVNVIDINQEKLDLAIMLGVDKVFNSMSLNSEQIYDQLSNNRFEQLILETAGVPDTVKLSIQVAGPKAQIGLVGTLHNDLTLSHKMFSQILRKELIIIGSWMNYSKPWPGSEWKDAVELINNGKIKVEPLINSINKIDDYIEEVKELNGKPMNGKIVLKFN